MTDHQVNIPELGEYLANTARRRAEAFCDAPQYVLGMEVGPLTPRTYSMLYATRSAFVVGGSVTERDVRNFVWFHSKLHCHYGKCYQGILKWWALRKLRANLSPLWCRLLRLKPPVHRYVATLAICSAEIQALVQEAFADSPPRSAGAQRPIACAQAYFVYEFAAACGWTPERTSNTPLRQLIQLHRCVKAARGQEVQDDGEEQIEADYLRRRNIELIKSRLEKLNG
jgi:hypothetical protein